MISSFLSASDNNFFQFKGYLSLLAMPGPGLSAGASFYNKTACFREKGNRLFIYLKRHALPKKGCLFSEQHVSSAARLSLNWTRGFVPPDLSGFTFSETVYVLVQLLPILSYLASNLIGLSECFMLPSLPERPEGVCDRSHKT
jgi:hypothetical protein